MIRAHASTNGYFGGYIAKRQPCGRFEAKKCINKMHELRRKKAGASAGGKLRAASGRVVTDLEMNGVLRGAVEEFNLCKNLRQGDVLFAECVRTYATITVNAQEWLHRLEVELQPLRTVAGSRHVPATSRPSFRTTRVRAPLVDLYGFRPLTDELSLLSPYEFVQYWEALPVTQPGLYEDEDSFADWTTLGKAELRKGSFRDGKTKCQAGKHFVVLEPEGGEYVTFPDKPDNIYKNLRHLWVLRRRNRPEVPVLEGVALPRQGRSQEQNAKYCSVFFRPWTLLEGAVTSSERPDRSVDVPHLRQLGVIEEECPPDDIPIPEVEKSLSR